MTDDVDTAGALDDVVPRLLRLTRVAEQLDVPRESLREMSEAGAFPPIVWLSERRAYVRADALRQWFRERELAGNPATRRAEYARAAGAGSAMPRCTPAPRRGKGAARRPKPSSRASRDYDQNPRPGSVADRGGSRECEAEQRGAD